MVWTLSGGSINRDTEQFLLWELPFSRALQYFHCALRANLRATVKGTAPDSPELKKSAEVKARAAEVDAELSAETYC